MSSLKNEEGGERRKKGVRVEGCVSGVTRGGDGWRVWMGGGRWEWGMQ